MEQAETDLDVLTFDKFLAGELQQAPVRSHHHIITKERGHQLANGYMLEFWRCEHFNF